MVGQEEVDPGQTLAVDGAEGADRQLAHGVGDFVVDLGGDVEFGCVLEVFGREVVEAVLAASYPSHPDLADGTGFDRAIGEFEDAAFEFAARHCGFDDHLRIVPAGQVDRRLAADPTPPRG